MMRKNLKQFIPVKCIPSLVLYTRLDLHAFGENLRSKHNEKLSRLSKEQDKPLFNVENTVTCYGLDKTPPKYVLETLALGPRNPIMEKFDQNDVLAELDSLMEFCKNKKLNEEIITDINVKTLSLLKTAKNKKYQGV